MVKRIAPTVIAGAGVAGILSLFIIANRPAPSPKPAAKVPIADRIVREAGPDRAGAESKLNDFVRRNASNSDVKMQDEVGRARLHLGYLAAKRQDFPAARAVFQTAAREYRGSGVMTQDFGGIPDQAAYQAAACLVAQGKREVARAEFRRFMRERALSPLVHAAFRRLQRLNDGQVDPADDRLLQKAIAAQEARVRFETSVCGPKAIAHLLPLLGRPGRDYREIARLCGTTEHGTTLAGMRKGLAALGLEAHGYEVNRKDFAALEAPFLLLQEDHYVVVTSILGNRVQIFDSRGSADAAVKLPPEDDPDFRATVLTVAPTAQGETR